MKPCSIVCVNSITCFVQSGATRRRFERMQQLNQVTLYSQRSHRDWSRASVNFETGERGSSRFDLTYGNLAVNHDGNWFEVRDARSMIIDLGAKQWGDFKETPSFFKGKKPRKPLPLSRPKVVDASADSKEISPYQQFVRVKAGHMYLMKVMKERKTTYIMFRVDSLIKEDNCVLSWKKVPPPVDEMEKGVAKSRDLGVERLCLPSFLPQLVKLLRHLSCVEMLCVLSRRGVNHRTIKDVTGKCG